MSPYGEVWNFTRERLAQSYQDLTTEQLLWRPHAKAHNIGEWLYHIAGAECWFAMRMSTNVGTDAIVRTASAARSQFIDDTPFPFHDSDMTLDLINGALESSADFIRPVIENPTQEQLEMGVETVIGPVVPGVACLWRVAQHAAYHTGQIWVYRFDPRFPN